MAQPLDDFLLARFREVIPVLGPIDAPVGRGGGWWVTTPDNDVSPPDEMNRVEGNVEILRDHRPDEAHCRWCGDAWPCRNVRLLALPYSDHPDYRPEWAPLSEDDHFVWHIPGTLTILSGEELCLSCGYIFYAGSTTLYPGGCVHAAAQKRWPSGLRRIRREEAPILAY